MLLSKETAWVNGQKLLSREHYMRAKTINYHPHTCWCFTLPPVCRSQMRSAVLAASNRSVLSLGEADGAPCFGIRPGPLPGSATPNAWKNVPLGCSAGRRVTLPPSWASIHLTRRWVSFTYSQSQLAYVHFEPCSVLHNISLKCWEISDPIWHMGFDPLTCFYPCCLMFPDNFLFMWSSNWC